MLEENFVISRSSSLFWNRYRPGSNKIFVENTWESINLPWTAFLSIVKNYWFYDGFIQIKKYERFTHPWPMKVKICDYRPYRGSCSWLTRWWSHARRTTPATLWTRARPPSASRRFRSSRWRRSDRWPWHRTAPPTRSSRPTSTWPCSCPTDRSILVPGFTYPFFSSPTRPSSPLRIDHPSLLLYWGLFRAFLLLLRTYFSILAFAV